MTVIKDARGTPLFLERKHPNIGWWPEAAEPAPDRKSRAKNGVAALNSAVDLGAGRTYSAVVIPADPKCAQ